MSDYIIKLEKWEKPLEIRDIISDERFLEFLKSYYRDSRKADQPNSEYFHEYVATSVRRQLKGILNNKDEVMKEIRSLSDEQREEFLNLIDSVYNYWRSYSRYVYFDNSEDEVITHQEFIRRFDEFSNVIVSFYRKIYETVLGREQTIYRILPSGGNAGLLLNRKHLELPEDLSFLEGVHLVESLITQPPFIIKTKENKRRGVFFYQDRRVGPENLDVDDAAGIIIDVYDTRGLFICDKRYISFLVALGNLFQVEPFTRGEEKKFDFIVLFGTKDTGDRCYYYKDEDTYVGVCPREAKIDYFGYAKKIVLTLFNLTMIDRRLLPIHGAGVKIRRGEKTKNLFFLGDSGAGKSETLEAIRTLYKKRYQIDTIFDDMGTFHLKDGDVFATGTEIGAFVRLDDLSQGYSLRSVDRAVYFNIDEENSRVVIPIEDFLMTYTFHHVDAFLLCDNYTDTINGIQMYKDAETAIRDFERGERVALNTTSERGFVSTYFANPFGPLQRRDDVESYIGDYFRALFDKNIPVGKLYTRLSLDHKNGPIEGAKALIELFEKL